MISTRKDDDEICRHFCSVTLSEDVLNGPPIDRLGKGRRGVSRRSPAGCTHQKRERSSQRERSKSTPWRVKAAAADGLNWAVGAHSEPFVSFSRARDRASLCGQNRLWDISHQLRVTQNRQQSRKTATIWPLDTFFQKGEKLEKPPLCAPLPTRVKKRLRLASPPVCEFHSDWMALMPLWCF